MAGAGVFALVLALAVLLGGCSGGTGEGETAQDSPLDAVAALQSAVDSYNEGEFFNAENALADLVKADPGNTEARKALALALSAQGRNDEAIEQYRAVLETDPEDHVALYRMALLERLTGAPEEAVEHLERAVELNRDDSYVDELARTYMQLGNYREAADTWGALAAEEGRAPESTVELLKLQAEALRLAEDIDGAKAALGRALELVPDSADVKARLEALGD